MRIGLIGTGGWARTVHGTAAREHPSWELAGVWGRDAAKAGDLADALACRSAPSFDELLEQVDAVAFAVPPQVQAPLALQAARAGKHLLLEKPVALDPAQADELVAAAADVAAVVFLTRLWSPLGWQWVERVRTQGGWTAGRMAQVASLSEDFLGGSPWRAEHGALWDVGPHALSLLEAVLGPVVQVRGVRGVRDHVQLALRHESGAASTADLCLTAAPAAAHTTAEFWGDEGRSEPLPGIAPQDMQAEVVRAATAALSDLHARATGQGGAAQGADLTYGAHLTHLLAAAEQGLS